MRHFDFHVKINILQEKKGPTLLFLSTLLQN